MVAKWVYEQQIQVAVLRLTVDRIPLEAIDGEFSESKRKYIPLYGLWMCNMYAIDIDLRRSEKDVSSLEGTT